MQMYLLKTLLLKKPLSIHKARPTMKSAAFTASARPHLVALFISDLHLQPTHELTSNAFIKFLQQQGPHTPQIFILGDLFEYWLGDDGMDSPWHQRIIHALRDTTDAGIKINIIVGNRDFLIGDDFFAVTGTTKLPDPYVLEDGEHRLVLTHGDALCTDDHRYMAFRAHVRNPETQAQFLSQPIAARQKMIEEWRKSSEEEKKSKSSAMMDVNQEAATALFAETNTTTMIHGHTHRPTCHDSDDGKYSRYVLTDWDCENKPERGGWISLYSDGSIRQHDIQGRIVTDRPEQHHLA